MTKETANEIKKVLKENGFESVKYYSPKETLIVDIAYWQDNYIELFNTTLEAIIERSNKRLVELLNIITNNGYRPKYEVKRKRFQGFINVIQVHFN